ncbi:MAG: hypothetical protein LBG80_20010 [Bacteroidales bacterium]|jgi:hypothetical protein|nr:hypothetical protein [Bacteroidales bacterium]
MRKEELVKGKEYAHKMETFRLKKKCLTVMYKYEVLVFEELVIEGGFYYCIFKTKTGKTKKLASWYVEKNISEYRVV